MRDFDFPKVAVLAVVALMVLSVFAAGAGMAATTTAESDWSDTETTEEEITDNVVVDFNASEGQLTTVIVETEQTFDADALSDADLTLEDWDTLELEIAYENTTHTETVAVDEEDADISLTDTTGEVPAEAYFEIDHDELETLPGGATESTIVDVTITEIFEDAGHVDADEDDMVSVETEFVAEFQFDNTHATVYADDDSATIEDVEAGTLNKMSLGMLGDSDPADLYTFEETVAIDGDNTTVNVHDGTSDGDDAFDDAIGDRDAGDLIFGASAAADGVPVLAFYEEADDDIVDDNTTYAVYDDGVWTYHLGEDYADDESFEAYIVSQSYTDDDFDREDLESAFVDQADMGTIALMSNFGTMDALSNFGFGILIPLSIGSGLGVLALGFVVTRRRRRAAA